MSIALELCKTVGEEIENEREIVAILGKEIGNKRCWK